MSRPPVLRLHDELVVDNFAGGGGASLGIEWALGRSPDIAVNHDPEAVAMHQANHPSTRHLCGDVWEVDPRAVCGGRPVGLAWFSPDCTHHSVARGQRPFREQDGAPKRRALAWVVVRWARTVRPRVICLENVGEFEDWGPLDNDGKRIPEKAGLTFRIWLGKLKAAGYAVEMRTLRACDYGAPTIRKRLFIIARCDGKPIVWPEPTHGPGLLRPHRTAAECIQWEIPVRSIFGRKKPLADNTLARIARGVQRFVIESGDPFIIPVTHPKDQRVHSIREPLRTITSAKRGELSLIAPTLIQSGWGERKGQAPRIADLHAPLGTIMAEGVKHALVGAHLVKHYGGVTGQGIDRPMGTVTAKDHHGLVLSHMLKLRGSCKDGQDWRQPAPTVTSGGLHLAEVRSFLIKYNRTGTSLSLELPFHTVTTRDRFALVSVRGQAYVIVDIGQRMLKPRELFRAQSFPDSYQVETVECDGKPLTQEAQVRMCGNSVSPVMAKAIVGANLARDEVAVA